MCSSDLDSKGFEGLLDEKDEGKDLYLDAGYVMKEMLYHGQVPVVLVLEVQENLLHTQLRWQLKQQLKQLCRMVLNQ